MPLEQQIKFDDAQVKAALERLRLSLPLGGDMTPAMTSIGRILKTGTQLRFRSQQSPEGDAWKPSQRAEAESGQTLRLTSRLRNSITYAASHDRVEVGTNVVYGAIHQFGGVVGRATGKAGPVRRPRLPARPYLGASEDDRTDITQALNDHLRGAWR